MPTNAASIQEKLLERNLVQLADPGKGRFRTLLLTALDRFVIDRWRKDHPGETEVPKNLRQNLSNVKSDLRQKLRKKPGRRKQESQPAVPSAALAEAPRKSARRLEALEEQIDECLVLAKELDREGLASVISLLRRARNEVVWKMGE